MRWRRRRSHGRLVGTFWSPRSAPRPQEIYVKMIPGFARCRIVGLRSPHRPWAARQEQLSLFSVRPRVALAPSTWVGLVVFGVPDLAHASSGTWKPLPGVRALQNRGAAVARSALGSSGAAISSLPLVRVFSLGADFRIFWISALFRKFREVSQVKKRSVGHPFISSFFGFSACSRTLWRLVLGRSRPIERPQS